MNVASLVAPFGLAPVFSTGAREAARLHTEDQEAILACQRGDKEAFDKLVERYQRDVYRVCFRYVNNHQDASDMAQEAFLKAYRAIGRFRGESSFSTWIYRIAINTCLNFRAARKPQAEDVTEALEDRSPGALDGVLSDERSKVVREAVSRLPERQRATLILKVYHELSHEEVAKALGSSVGTVKANLFHALSNLRKLLDARGGE